MKIELFDRNRSGIMNQFAKALGTKIQRDTILIPKSKGGGFIKFKKINEDLRVMIRNYYLKDQLEIKRINELGDNRFILFSFLDIFEPFEKNKGVSHQFQQPKVVAFSETASSLITFPSNTFFRAINIVVSQNYLLGILGKARNPIISKMLENTEPFVFESAITSNMVKCANDFINEKLDKEIELMFYKLKCEELLCYYFSNLMKRKDQQISKIHADDIKAIYKVKDYLSCNLHSSPNIRNLAAGSGMSEPKLRKLFKQTFGKGVFEYYQSLRMQEAVRLLKEERLSVSEVGYKLGFTNLSHFTRVFEENIGMKPKKWSMIN